MKSLSKLFKSKRHAGEAPVVEVVEKKAEVKAAPKKKSSKKKAE